MQDSPGLSSASQGTFPTPCCKQRELTDPVIFNFIFICVHMCLPTCLCVHHVCVDALTGQKMVLDARRLELETVVSHQVGAGKQIPGPLGKLLTTKP